MDYPCTMCGHYFCCCRSSMHTVPVFGPISTPTELSDADIERIAKRVVELLKKEWP